jgi:hypothetical protein
MYWGEGGYRSAKREIADKQAAATKRTWRRICPTPVVPTREGCPGGSRGAKTQKVTRIQPHHGGVRGLPGRRRRNGKTKRGKSGSRER